MRLPRPQTFKKAIKISVPLAAILVLGPFSAVRTSWSKEVSAPHKNFPGSGPQKEQFPKDLSFGLKRAFVTKQPGALEVSAKSALVFDLASGEVLFEKEAHQKLPPASIAKILTAAVALETYSKDERITVSERAAAAEPNKVVMKAGERIRVEDLLYGLMMISANDAAEVIAEGYGREKFLERMDARAASLGLTASSFANPSGLDDPGLYTTANDIAVITHYALKKHPEILTYMGTKEHTVKPSEANEGHWLYHISDLLYVYKGIQGVKTGFTDNAGHTIVAVADRGRSPVVALYLDATNSFQDANALLDYGLARQLALRG